MLKSIYRYIINLLFPKICEGCGRVEYYLCKKCRIEKIQYIESQYCHVCKKLILEGFIHKECIKNTYLDGVFVVSEYSKFIESYIADIKYHFYYAMLDELVEIMINYILHNQNLHQIITSVDYITYVPLHFMRQNWRGFNQSELIAKGVGQQFKKEPISLLKRVINTKTQVGLGREDRLKNLQDCFDVHYSFNKVLQGKSIIIIDDVMTTGATLEECSKILKSKGADQVYGLVFAREMKSSKY